MTYETNTLIIGASLSGLSTAACLQKENIPYLIIEREDKIATPWRNHYERLHLHTNKRVSHLPFKKFARNIPRYPSRQEVIDYLENYQKEFSIHPFFNTEALAIKKEDDYWITKTFRDVFRSKYLVIATGVYSRPRRITFKGIESFNGKILHSRDYKKGKDFTGQKVLVVGFGNSACEIAIDLYEQGAYPSMSVRSPVNVIPRDVLGIPVLELSLLLRGIPPRVADKISAPLMHILIGDLSRFGLKKKSYGPIEQIHRDAQAPILDIGTVKNIRKGNIKIYDGIDFIQHNCVHFKDGKEENFDAIVAAIGYDKENAEIIDVDRSRFQDLNKPVAKQKFFGKDGLYFCGFWISPTGQIREIALDARKIAKHLASEAKQAPGVTKR